jgi:hypothetical protein
MLARIPACVVPVLGMHLSVGLCHVELLWVD